MRRLLLASLCFLSLTDVGCDENYFINPPAEGQTVDYSYVNNPVWLWGSNQTLSWSTNYPLFTVTLWQQPVFNGKDYFYPLVGKQVFDCPFLNHSIPPHSIPVLDRMSSGSLKPFCSMHQSSHDNYLLLLSQFSQLVQHLFPLLDRRYRPRPQSHKRLLHLHWKRLFQNRILPKSVLQYFLARQQQ